MKKPYFSIIIPVAPDRGAEVLKSIAKLDFPKNQYEVIVERGANTSRNRNNGAKKAKGEILCFLDDDAIIPTDLLKNAKSLFENTSMNIHWGKQYKRTDHLIDILGGPQLTPPDDKWFAKACGEVLASKFGSMSMSKRYRQEKEDFNADENSLTSCIMFVRADAFKKIGGFNESLFPGEDPEFLARAKEKKCRIVYSPDIYIYHRRRSNLLGYCEQMFSYGRMRLAKEKSAKSDGKKGLLFYIPMLFAFYIIAIAFGISSLSPIFILPLTLYILIAFLCGLHHMKKDWSYLLLTPLIYFITHLSYGLGMVEGWLGKYL